MTSTPENNSTREVLDRQSENPNLLGLTLVFENITSAYARLQELKPQSAKVLALKHLGELGNILEKYKQTPHGKVIFEKFEKNEDLDNPEVIVIGNLEKNIPKATFIL